MGVTVSTEIFHQILLTQEYWIEKLAPLFLMRWKSVSIPKVNHLLWISAQNEKKKKKGSVYNIRRQDWHTKMKITSPPVALESVETALSVPFSFLPADRSWKTKSSPITSWIRRPAVRIHPSHSTDRRLRSLKSISACSSPWSRRS